MSYFSYRAIGSDGVMVRGIAEAEDADFVFESLSAKGLSILDVRKSNATIAALKRTLNARKVKRTEIIELASNLSIMLRAGVPLLTALDDIADSLENKYFKGIIADVKHLIEAGERFSDALESQKGAFPPMLIRLARVGEETGRLDKSLADVADHLQKMEYLAQAIKRALIYPAFAIVATTGALVFWLVYVLPKIMTAIKEMGVKMPLITRMLLHISDFTRVYWYVIPLVPAAICAAVIVLKQNSTTGYYLDALKIRLPIVKLVVYNKLLALFTEQMRILVMAGIPVDRSFDIVAEIMGNEVFKRAVLQVKESVSSGSGMADSLKAHSVFPHLVVRMIGIGETSGNLDGQFAFLSGYYLKKLDDISQKMGKMVEPIVIGVIGALFAVIIIGLILPIYDLVSGLGKR